MHGWVDGWPMHACNSSWLTSRAAPCAPACNHTTARIHSLLPPVSVLWPDPKRPTRGCAPRTCMQVIDDPAASPRAKIAARLTKIEKGILMACQEELAARGAPSGEAAAALVERAGNGSGNGNGSSGSSPRLSSLFDSSFCG